MECYALMFVNRDQNHFCNETNINLTLPGGPIMIAACEHDLKT